MKPYCYYFLLLLFALMCVACNVDAPSEISLDKREISMEIFTHTTLIEQTEYLQQGIHDDFLSTDVVAMLVLDPFLYRKMKRIQSERIDTVFSCDEIPLIRETKTSTRIYADGTSETCTEFLTPYTDNIVYRLTAAPVPEKSRIALTVVKDGLLCAYNADGDLLLQEVFPESNMSEFLDTMRVYVMKDEKVRTDVYELPNGNMMMEMPTEKNENSTSTIRKIKGVVKSCVELNPEMNKILQYELYQGKNLIQRKKYTYSENQCLVSLHKGKVVTQNPESVETYTIVMNGNGKPVIRHSKEFYKRNQSYYYFN